MTPVEIVFYSPIPVNMISSERPQITQNSTKIAFLMESKDFMAKYESLVTHSSDHVAHRKKAPLTESNDNHEFLIQLNF